MTSLPPTEGRLGATPRRPWRYVQAASLALDASAVFVGASLAGASLPGAAAASLLGALLLQDSVPRVQRLTLRLSVDIPSIGGRLAVVSVLAGALSPSATAITTAMIALFTWALVIVGRSILLPWVTVARRTGMLAESTLIVGAGPTAAAVAEALIAQPHFGLRPVGYVDDMTGDLEVPRLGRIDELTRILDDMKPGHVIFAYGNTQDARMVSVVRECATRPVNLYSLPRFFELGHEADPRATEDLWGFPLVRLRSGHRVTRMHTVKRALDVSVGSVLLALALPILALLAVAVKVSSPGPALFRQERVGRDGQLFELLKFRSMKVNDDSDSTWSVEDDDRVTRIGRILRPTHLDELPQLWNVMRGDMSLVGPRPERPVFVAQFDQEIPGYGDRHRVPSGLTGWAQVHGLWGDTSIPERARFDNHYIERWSLWNDLVILARTARTVLGGQR